MKGTEPDTRVVFFKKFNFRNSLLHRSFLLRRYAICIQRDKRKALGGRALVTKKPYRSLQLFKNTASRVAFNFNPKVPNFNFNNCATLEPLQQKLPRASPCTVRLQQLHNLVAPHLYHSFTPHNRTGYPNNRTQSHNNMAPYSPIVRGSAQDRPRPGVLSGKGIAVAGWGRGRGSQGLGLGKGVGAKRMR